MSVDARGARTFCTRPTEEAPPGTSLIDPGQAPDAAQNPASGVGFTLTWPSGTAKRCVTFQSVACGASLLGQRVRAARRGLPIRGSDRDSVKDLEVARPGAIRPEPPGWMTV